MVRVVAKGIKMDMDSLTQVQRSAFEFILLYLQKCGHPPTLREITTHFNWKSVSSAQDVIAALRKKGFLSPNCSGKARQIMPSFFVQPDRVVEPAKHLHPFPLLGRVEAGFPHEAIEYASKESVFFPVSSNISAKKAHEFFVLVIDGYSMLHAGLLPKDLVLVEKGASPKNGDIVVAVVKDYEITVKRYAIRGSSLFRERLVKDGLKTSSVLPSALLVPENPLFSSIPFGLCSSHKILGVVRSVYRECV